LEKKVKQLFLEKGKVTQVPVPTPPLSNNHILVAVRHSFVSTGTESATLAESKKSLIQKSLTNTTEKINKIAGAVKENGIRGTVALIKGNLNKKHELGYSCSGEVVEVGKDVKNFSVGDFVACAGAGISNHAEYISVPIKLSTKLPNDKFLKQASLTTIGAIALQGIRRANLMLGEKVCIIGLGLIGQITIQLAKLSGCTVYGIDIDDTKLFLAQKFGCDHVYNPLATSVEKAIQFHSEHYGVDTTIITAASQTGYIIQQAMEITRRKGKVILVGDVKIDFDRNPFYQKEIDFLISCSYGPGRYDQNYEKHGKDYPYAYVRWTENRNMKFFSKLIYDKKITIDPLITHEYQFEHADEAYEQLEQKKSTGIILTYPKQKKPPKLDIATDLSEQPIAYAQPYVVPKDTLTLGIIGAGGFAKTKLLPLISQNKNIKIHTIIDANAANALNVARQYNAFHHHNDFLDIVRNKNIDAVIIATPHAFHTEQAIKCLKSGKAVFVEKPAAVTNEQLTKLQHFLESDKESLYCVDFNRSFSRFIKKIKQTISQRTTPLVAHYRMNAGFIPKDHWIQSSQHGGRAIGEACHIFELFCFLTNAKPIDIKVNSINPIRDDLLRNDNFSASISFDDGSICTLLYTSIGNTTLSKERMELFFDGKSIVMNDYKELRGYGFPKKFDEKTKSPDKGHKTLLTHFINAARGKEHLPLSTNRIILATKLSLEIDKLCRLKNP
jgi:predicted dehydrogenase